jgi:hypothetical protein
MNDTEKLQYLAGELNALRLVLTAIANTHPDPMRLWHEIDRLAELPIGSSAQLPVTDLYLRGYSDSVDNFRARMQETVSRSRG